MTTGIKNFSFQKEYSDKSDMHLLPCKIHYNGDANIANYFKPASKNESEGEMSVSFRGYPLNGKLINVPENYHGFVFKSESSENLIAEKKFDSLAYWEWDKTPSKNDPFLSALDWLHLSSKVHDPVEES